jgi:hypothetical protein
MEMSAAMILLLAIKNNLVLSTVNARPLGCTKLSSRTTVSPTMAVGPGADESINTLLMEPSQTSVQNKIFSFLLNVRPSGHGEFAT